MNTLILLLVIGEGGPTALTVVDAERVPRLTVYSGDQEIGTVPRAPTGGGLNFWTFDLMGDCRIAYLDVERSTGTNTLNLGRLKANGQLVDTHVVASGHLRNPRFAPGGGALAYADASTNEVIVLDTAGRKTVRRYPGLTEYWAEDGTLVVYDRKMNAGGEPCHFLTANQGESVLWKASACRGLTPTLPVMGFAPNDAPVPISDVSQTFLLGRSGASESVTASIQMTAVACQDGFTLRDVEGSFSSVVRTGPGTWRLTPGKQCPFPPTPVSRLTSQGSHPAGDTGVNKVQRCSPAD